MKLRHLTPRALQSARLFIAEGKGDWAARCNPDRRPAREGAAGCNGAAQVACNLVELDAGREARRCCLTDRKVVTEVT